MKKKTDDRKIVQIAVALHNRNFVMFALDSTGKIWGLVSHPNGKPAIMTDGWYEMEHPWNNLSKPIKPRK